jgi:hypothetical protein
MRATISCASSPTTPTIHRHGRPAARGRRGSFTGGNHTEGGWHETAGRQLAHPCARCRPRPLLSRSGLRHHGHRPRRGFAHARSVLDPRVRPGTGSCQSSCARPPRVSTPPPPWHARPPSTSMMDRALFAVADLRRSRRRCHRARRFPSSPAWTDDVLADGTGCRTSVVPVTPDGRRASAPERQRRDPRRCATGWTTASTLISVSSRSAYGKSEFLECAGRPSRRPTGRGDDCRGREAKRPGQVLPVAAALRSV